MSNTIRGSIAQLAGRVVVNGVALGQPELSMLTRIGRGHFCKPVEVIKHEGKRGKPTTVWEFDVDATMQFSFANANAAATVASGEEVEADAPEVVAEDAPTVTEDNTETVEAELDAATEL